MKFTNSYEVISLIENKKRNGIALRKCKAFMESLGNPQTKLKCIHIGGTNGKGSTTNVVSTVLQEAGYKVGMFTSPYLETHHDRIRVNERYIEDEAIVAYANAYYDKWVEYDLSMFEIDMFIAVQYFLDQKVDYAVFEVGLGGEQDATNIITPLVSAITNIGMDHMEYLGDTYEAIAKTKAGIIKEGVPFVTGEERECCLSVFASMCKQKHTMMKICEKPTNIHVGDMLSFDCGTYQAIKQPTLARYQANNTALAIAILDVLRKQKRVVFDDEVLYKGIAKAVWKGRFEIFAKKPLIVLDGAHNKEGIEALASSCEGLEKMQILFSALKDKPHHEMLERLLSVSDDVTVCEFPFYRAQSAEQLAEGLPVRMIKEYKQAIDVLLEKKKPLLICGSLYFISAARQYLQKKIQG